MLGIKLAKLQQFIVMILQLQENGLIDIRHGEGSFISFSNSSHKTNTILLDMPNQFAEELKKIVENYSQRGLDFAEIKKIFEETFAEIERGKTSPTIIFAECNQFQIKQISGILQEELNLNVNPLLVEDLTKEIPNLMGLRRTVNIITTGFHVNEVHEAIGDLPIYIDVLITNLNPETRRKLESFGEKATYSFICRDKESAVLYKDLLKAELGYNQIQLNACILSESEKVREILESSDVVLTSPPVYEEVKKLAPSEKVVFNVFERVDPMSLKVIKDRILGNIYL